MNMNSNLPDLDKQTGFDPRLPDKMGRLQKQFAAHIRDPEQQAAPDAIEDRRMAIYRELFYNNIEGFIANSFPVIRKLFADEQWHQLIRRFFRDYRCHTPLFPEIPREFIRFLEQENPCEDKPFLTELAHYEWVEMALELDDSAIDSNIKIDPHGDLLENKPILSAQAWLLRYKWPVHRISPDFQPQELPEHAIFILVNRNQDDRVEFTHLNQVSARLIELLSEKQFCSGSACLEQISLELGRENDPLILQTGMELLQSFRTQEIIVGTTKI